MSAALTIAGAPIRSEIRPPRDGLIPNYYRKSNPFAADSEPDWISPSTQTGADGFRTVGKTGQERPPVPPRSGGVVTPSGTIATRSHVPVALEEDLVSRSTAASLPKSPPPVPSKPIALSSRPRPSPPPKNITRTASVPDSRGRLWASDRGRQGSFASTRTQFTASQQNPSADRHSTEHLDSPSAGRVRGANGQARALLDDDVGDNLDWKPLLPNP